LDATIREIRVSDVPAVVAIIRAHSNSDGDAAEGYYRAHYGPQRSTDLPVAHHYVAEDVHTEEMLGVTGYEPDKYQTPGVYWLSWTYVRADARRKGIGSALLQHVKDELRRLRARKLYIDTSSDASYTNAVRLYQKHGFVIQACLPGYYGPGEDYVILALDL